MYRCVPHRMLSQHKGLVSSILAACAMARALCTLRLNRDIGGMRTHARQLTQHQTLRVGGNPKEPCYVRSTSRGRRRDSHDKPNRFLY